MNKQIYIIRHGQTDYNIKQIVQGRGVNSDLNETGRLQAQLFFEQYKTVPFDTIFTSALKRIQQTVAPFLENKIPHIIRKEIDEIAWGIFEGVQHHPSLQERYYGIIESWKNGAYDNIIEGGESPNELKQRLTPFIEEIKTIEAENILVCTHGRTLRMLMCLILNKPISEMDNFQHENTCLYQFEYYDNSFSLVKANDLAHLRD